ncbi:4-diphosphocytidyl-2C-methyl-D-erythritol synthase [Scytonema hofmannii PCC 7110]|uniref:4-diphosphocytidyl-2C-methyl-D-erythritol synthase n=1 Tax=Scytonema hofmannii PCC 7110 TaxID=128403 RepID=A0A139WVE4_9CYAN|nr:nucleotidyltransferase family protein [Scytonema hofmannii]KYC36405.1 4-diphosphocytidyl-2C-methyl-D-erythritol synthase [Scytonema hofmannii PCC 7110]
MSNIGLILLAAGASTRMGTPKQLLQYQQHSLLRHMVEVALASVCNPVIVVLGAYADRIRPEVELPNVRIVENDRWSEGMSTSIRSGIEALNDDVEAVVLMLCDQPFVSTQIINQLVHVFRATDGQIVASEYGGVQGVPALFKRTLFAELLTLSGAAGARQVIKQNAGEVFSLSFPEGIFDLDTRNDYERFQKLIAVSFLKRC